MSQITAHSLESMLTDYGWAFQNTGENHWLTGFQGSERYFPLSIRLTQTCVSFEIRPLIDLRIDSPRYQMLSRELLELNTRLQVAKLAVNDVGEVSLACQVLANSFDADMLGHILGIIGYYADEVAPEIYHRLAAFGPETYSNMLS